MPSALCSFTRLTFRTLRADSRAPRLCIAPFSQSTRVLAQPSYTRPADETAQSRAEPAEGRRRKKRKFAIPAIAFFGVAIPLAWYFKTRLQQESTSSFAHPSEFVKYTLVGKDNVSPICAIFRLRPSGNKVIDVDNPELEHAITSVEFKQPQLQIARSYTCLPQQDGQPVDELRFLIRREQKGEVSNFLHRLLAGAEIEVRGLHCEYNLSQGVKSVVFLVGGTGIAPAMQITDALEGVADIYILWANRRRDDCVGGYNDKITKKSTWSWWPRSSASPSDDGQDDALTRKGSLVTMLESLKRQSMSSPGNEARVKVDYYVDEEGNQIKTQDVKDALNALTMRNDRNGTGEKVLCVSGPPGFIAHWAGSKQWANGREVQGPLGGVLSTIDLGDWKVVKL